MLDREIGDSVRDGNPNENRPKRPAGEDTGRLRDGGPINKGDIQKPLAPRVFVGPRAEMDLPYLFMRANAGDLGLRQITNAPFWESPDIIALPGVMPLMAPSIPPKENLDDTARAGEPNTFYAHIWNFGKASAHEVVVEFYWCDPSLGINASSVRLIAQIMTSLGHKGSGNCHRVVKCPEPWSPEFLNGGHEYLVRVWDNQSDFPGEPKFDASWNRHVAQRNIHVVRRNGGAMPLMLHRGADLSSVPGHAANQRRQSLWRAGPGPGPTGAAEHHALAPTVHWCTRDLPRGCTGDGRWAMGDGRADAISAGGSLSSDNN